MVASVCSVALLQPGNVVETCETMDADAAAMPPQASEKKKTKSDQTLLNDARKRIGRLQVGFRRRARGLMVRPPRCPFLIKLLIN